MRVKKETQIVLSFSKNDTIKMYGVYIIQPRILNLDGGWKWRFTTQPVYPSTKSLWYSMVRGCHPQISSENCEQMILLPML
jgi:hypothetical protein